MKKIINIFAILTIFTFIFFSGKSYAATLDTIDINTDKNIVRPGEEVKVTINFGQELGAYTFDVSYDNNIFEYVSAEGGTANDTTDKIKVVYYDSTGGSNPRTNMSVTFKAKADLTTSNPTEFTITAEGLANADASVTFDDITTPIVKNVTVEPEYVDYTLKLEHTGDIIKGKEKDMVLSYSSSMGRYYEHARLIAEATTPTGATVQLIGKDSSGAEHDIIQSGWGDAQGYKIGGKDVSQVLNVKAIFSEIGDYTITLKLIDRDNSDHVIVEKAFNFTAKETTVETTQEEEVPPTQEQVVNEEKKPTHLPKTGNNMYVPIAIVLVLLGSVLVYYNKKR